MYVIGISALDKEVSVTLFENNQPIFSISEERLTRRKMQDGFPWKGMDLLFAKFNLRPEQIQLVAYPFFTAEKEFLLALLGSLSVLKDILRNKNLSFKEKLLSIRFLPKSLKDNYQCHLFCDRELKKGLKHWQLLHKLKRFHHTLAHAASVYYSSGYDEALIQISDWYGSGLSGGIFLGKGPDIKPLITYKWPNSLGSFYARYTIALGLSPDRHEGKVMGLAAYGDPSVAFQDFMNEFELREDGTFLQKNCLFHPTQKIIRDLMSADIAAAAQSTFEIVLLSSLQQVIKKFPQVKNICLAGGSMVNVKYNQLVSELSMIDRIAVFPAMTDCGTGYGAACLAIRKSGSDPRHFLDHVFLSDEFSREQILHEIQKWEMDYIEAADYEDTVANLLANNYIVGHFNGKMEFGPRALGNRSILANPAQTSVAAKLNNQLHRSNFMPFAPSTTMEIAQANLPALLTLEQPVKFMAVTTKLDSFWSDKIPAAMHLDQTARIHVCSRETSPVFHRIIDLFYQKTGIPALLNTSFNIHEEPIVYSPEDALKAFCQAHLDFLAMKPFIISLNKSA